MDGIESIELEDIEMAEKLNFRIKLLGITEIIDNKLFERVHTCLIKKDTYIANINGVMNAIILDGKPVGQSVMQGEGAGPGGFRSVPQMRTGKAVAERARVVPGLERYLQGRPRAGRKNIGHP